MPNFNSPLWSLLIMAIGGAMGLSAGFWILITPNEKLFAWDSRVGYRLYHWELKRSGDAKQALEFATGHYKPFGYLVTGFFAIYLLIVVAAFIATATGLIEPTIIRP